MFCAISGNAPEHPVISTKSGHLFEQSVVEKYIESTGKCPVTGEPLAADDLLPLKITSTVKPRPVAASSIPGMLTLFQNEWDALMLETFTLKQHLETARQELGQALYQHDAACRVIARLIKERDEARQALAEARPSAALAAPPAPQAAAAAPAPAAMEVEGGAAAAGPALTPEVVAAMEAAAKTLSKGRKKRQPPADQLGAEGIAALGVLGSHALHKKKGDVCVDVHASEPLAATGGADGAVALYDCAGAAPKATIKAHKKPVLGVKLHPSKPLVLSCSADKTAKCSTTAGDVLHTVSVHTGAVNGVTLHATGDYYVTASSDKSWAMHDIERGETLLVTANGTAGYSCAGFHPDGMILGTGCDALMRIWDAKSQVNIVTLEGHTAAITCLAFSENGYYLATGAADGLVKLWDLRKTKTFHDITPAAGGAVGSLSFDLSGGFLAVGANEVGVYDTKTWSTVASFADNSAAVTGVGFGRAAATIVAAASDGVVKLYGAAS